MTSTLVQRSLEIIQAGQAASGAYIASPAFPAYNYSWFRDGTFIADTMNCYHDDESATRFYDWAARVIIAREDAILRCLQAVEQGQTVNHADLLHTRYTLDEQVGTDDWPNFQLDGFGTLLWGIRRHQSLAPQQPLPAHWLQTVHLLIHYLAALWQYPNYDCWEEFPDAIAVSTLAALYAGLQASSSLPEIAQTDQKLAQATAEKISDMVLSRGTHHGHLIKQIDGADEVDASLLWASVPFGEYALFPAHEPLMRATVARIEADLIGTHGGVHRYRRDTYFGGGEWILLTGLLGEYRVAINDHEAAQQCLAFMEANATPKGELPEQITSASLHPEYISHWIDLCGPVAQPLLWSHAAYLNLSRQLHG